MHKTIGDDDDDDANTFVVAVLEAAEPGQDVSLFVCLCIHLVIITFSNRHLGRAAGLGRFVDCFLLLIVLLLLLAARVVRHYE